MEQVSEFLPGILLAYSAFLLAIISPGPNVLAVMGTSMSAGRGAGIGLAVGVAFGSLTWATLTVLGLSAILATFASLLTLIKVTGGCYLLWLAYKSFKAARMQQDLSACSLDVRNRSVASYFVRGYIVMMTNPKAVLAWIAIVSLGMQKDAPLWVGAVIVLGTFSLSVMIHVLYALVFSSQLMIDGYVRARRLIQIVLGSAFAFAGVRLLVDRT